MKFLFENYRIELSDLAPTEKREISPIDARFYCLETKELCGTLKLFFVNVGLIQESKKPLKEIIESIGGLPKACALFTDNQAYSFGKFTEQAKAALNPKGKRIIKESGNFIFAQNLQIFAEFRGKGLGIKAVRETMKRLAAHLDFAFVVIMPYPLQNTWNAIDRKYLTMSEEVERMNFSALEKDKNKALENLRGLYESVGCRAVEGTDLMVYRIDELLCDC